MTIEEIYRKYRIMPQLRLHQYRVAAVSKLVCTNMPADIETDNIIAADLLHDMGNIIKFNLHVFPKYLEPEGFAYWDKVRTEYIAKYGSDEHRATYKIAIEIGVSERMLELLKGVGFSKSQEILASNDLSLKVTAYGDRRVSPKGIVSLIERETEGSVRYAKNKHLAKTSDKSENYDILVQANLEMEKQIFAECKIKPEDINDASCKNLIEGLKSFVI